MFLKVEKPEEVEVSFCRVVAHLLRTLILKCSKAMTLCTYLKNEFRIYPPCNFFTSIFFVSLHYR